MTEEQLKTRVAELESLLADARAKITTLQTDRDDAIKRRDSALNRAQDAEGERDSLKANAGKPDAAAQERIKDLEGKVTTLEADNETLTTANGGFVDRDKAKLEKLKEKLPEAFKDTLTDDIPLAKQIELAEKLIAAKPGAPGYRPPGEGGGEKNPWSKESFNLTEQFKIRESDPARAAQLEAAAG